MPFDLGLPIYGLAILGLVLALFRSRQFLVLALIPLPFWLFLETLNYKPPRFSLHLLPFLVLMAAIPAALWWGGRPLGKRLAAAVCLLVAGYSFAYSFSYIRCLDKNRDPRIKMEQWTQDKGNQKVAILGFDETNGRYGLCRYRHSIGLSGTALGNNPYKYLIVPDVIREVLGQWSRLEAEGYRYTANDWWPMHSPRKEVLVLVRELQRGERYRRIMTFENKPEFWGIRMEVIRLPFSYFWISNLRLDIFERTSALRRMGDTVRTGTPALRRDP